MGGSMLSCMGQTPTPSPVTRATPTTRHAKVALPIVFTGSRVVGLRLALGLSQAGLAARLGRHQPAISGWEAGERLPNRFAQIALNLLAKGLRATAESLDRLAEDANLPKRLTLREQKHQALASSSNEMAMLELAALSQSIHGTSTGEGEK